MKEEINFKEILNVKKSLKKQMPKASKYIPGFVYRIFEKITHQKEIVELLEENKSKAGLDWIQGVLNYFRVKSNVIGEEHIEKPGRYIFVSNHPLGGLDGMVSLSVIGKYQPKFFSLTNAAATIIPNLRSFVIPVCKNGRQSREFVAQLNTEMRGDAAILICPAGSISRKKKGIVTDSDWNQSFIKYAIKNERDIVPIHFDAQFSNSFYKLIKLFDFLRIGNAIELLFQMNETFKQVGKTFKVTFGKPISYNALVSDNDHESLAQKIKNHVLSLNNNPKSNLS